MSTEAPNTVFATVEEAIEEIRAGRFVVVVDDEDRENEGDLTIAAQFVTPEAVNFMATHGRGLICLCLTPERCEELGLRQMTDQNETPFGTAFTVSIEAREGVSTGISAHDRAHTIQVAIDPTSTAYDLVQPGHVFPLRARTGGVLQRSGQTEAAVDLARLAGLFSAGVVCEIMNDDGTMARVSDLIGYCEQHGLKMVTVADLIEYRRKHEKLVERVVSVKLPTEHGTFQAVAYEEVLTGKHHVALVKGDVDGAEDVLVRVHSECLTGDVFHSQRCDCGEQLDRALRIIEAEGKGVLLYLAQEGRGIGLVNKLQGVRAPGAGPRHGRGQPPARLRGRRARVRDRLADPRRSRPHDDPRAHEQSRRRSAASRASGSPSSRRSRSRSSRTPRTATTSTRSATRWGTRSAGSSSASGCGSTPRPPERSLGCCRMSDRYETPRWDDEPKDLLASEEPAAEMPDATEGESDLDASSENVLDGWPAADPLDVDARQPRPPRSPTPRTSQRPTKRPAGRFRSPNRPRRSPTPSRARRSLRPRLGLLGARARRAHGAARIRSARG